MELRVYYTFDDPRKVGKVYTPMFVSNCEVYNQSDIYTPQLLIDYNSSIYQANAFEVPLWGRTYFLEDVVVDAGGRMIISGRIDVLETYAQEIKALNATVTRNEFNENTNLVDPCVSFTPKRTVAIRQFQTTPFNIRNVGAARNFVLVTGGGKVNG